MVGWHCRLDGHEFEQALGVGDGQGSLVCCSPWGLKESDRTEQLNNNKASLVNLRKLKSYQVGSAHIIFSIDVVQSLSHIESLRPHGLKHARLPCPSLSPGVCSNSPPLSR